MPEEYVNLVIINTSLDNDELVRLVNEMSDHIDSIDTYAGGYFARELDRGFYSISHEGEWAPAPTDELRIVGSQIWTKSGGARSCGSLALGQVQSKFHKEKIAYVQGNARVKKSHVNSDRPEMIGSIEQCLSVRYEERNGEKFRITEEKLREDD